MAQRPDHPRSLLRRAVPAAPWQRAIVLDEQVLRDVTSWIRTAPRTAERIVTLIEHTLRDPFGGLGQSEPLKHRGADVWSRRITQEHRLVYVVGADRITFVQARYHY